MRGTVKLFDKTKGWGFLTGDDGKDAFVHQSEIQMKGFRTLDKDDIVEFEVEESEKGAKAINVQPVLTLAQMKRKAEKEGLDLVKATDRVLNTSGWLIVDENNAVQSGEKPLTIEEVAAYLEQ